MENTELKGEPKISKTILVIIGPSASGKTNFSVKVAKKLGKSVISADSRQVYKSLDYSTGKFPSTRNIKRGKKMWKISNVDYFGYDIVKPFREFSAYDFARFAARVIKKQKDNLPIICGGTGMYINALINNYDYKSLPANWELRKELDKKDSEELLQMLEKKGYDIELLNNSEKHNKQRLIRKIETYKSQITNDELQITNSKYRYLIVGIEKESYEESINHWINDNFDQAVKEVKWLLDKYPESPVFSGFIFSEIKEMLSGAITEEVAREKIFFEYKHYIKRQNTYFKKYFPTCVWFLDKEKALEYIQKNL